VRIEINRPKQRKEKSGEERQPDLLDNLYINYVVSRCKNSNDKRKNRNYSAITGIYEIPNLKLQNKSTIVQIPNKDNIITSQQNVGNLSGKPQ
jgi:hypothetical protein